ncbi:hypothetical protein LRP67_05710 [Nocardioides sp. cx-169]|uniref:hypothetical protein n=1 Tax=Nocardioides sp. cx-169 TaxID=2899080 RepID=UPI001E5A9BCF|nr:hypothetical protein [Nocardioides sp. cx-169]MCD4533572.1 hypothetical protein [Nocardioides sp. cx-169]
MDALDHPRVASWLRYVQEEWTPSAVPGTHSRIALLLPCTKMKPYFTSREHRGVNAALLGAGWRPSSAYDGPAELASALAPDESPDLLANAPLVRDGVVLDRFVISEPLALIPYEHTMYLPDALGGGPSPATSYDDPGLFEGRGTSVSPEHPTFSAVPRGDGAFAWGPAERAAYAAMHQAMVEALTTTLTRLAPSYDAVLAWVSPGLTHRSFLLGVLDAAPTGELQSLEVLPTPAQKTLARERLAERLASEGRPAGAASVRSIFARGDGHDTPLGLPELAATLVTRLDELTR